MAGARSTISTQGQPATVLAIGTATLESVITQDRAPDIIFRMTNTEHLTELKKKFTRICKASGIEKRHCILTEEVVRQNPSIAVLNAPSLGGRQNIQIHEVLKLGKLVAERAIEEWGKPVSKLTHLIVCTTGAFTMPAIDCKLADLLHLPSSVKRDMLYHLGCHGGAATLRLAKDIAENNPGARVLAVCVEVVLHGFHRPSEEHLDNLVNLAIFGDGASAVIVGADPDLSIERPIFEIISANQMLVPNSSQAIISELNEAGYTVHLSPDIPKHAAQIVDSCLREAFGPLGISNWNSIFWIVHPGGAAILDNIEAKVKLHEDKLVASRNVLANYGNMQSATAFFVVDEMRKQSVMLNKATTGEGLDLGVLFAFGPGMTVETIVLRAMRI